jgi:hypothetical protein
MNAPCTLDLGYGPVELPSYRRRVVARGHNEAPPVRLISDALKPGKIELVDSKRSRHLDRVEREILHAALSSSVRVRKVLRRV